MLISAKINKSFQQRFQADNIDFSNICIINQKKKMHLLMVVIHKEDTGKGRVEVATTKEGLSSDSDDQGSTIWRGRHDSMGEGRKMGSTFF